MYYEIKPSIKLRNPIDAFWVYSNDASAEQFKVLPDACTDLLIDLKENKVFVSGIMSSYQVEELPAHAELIGIRFKAEFFGSLAEIPLSETKNLKLEGSEIFPKLKFNCEKNLKDAKTVEQKICRLEEFMLGAFQKNNEKRDELIFLVASNIRRLNGNLNVNDLARHYNLSLRQLQRRFKNYIGLTIKEFSNIVRFNNAVQEIKNYPKTSFMELAFQLGFYDHAHMNNEFNRVAGENPSYFR